MRSNSSDTLQGNLSGRPGAFILLLKAIRPIEWIKNVFVLAPLFFSGQGKDFDKLFVVGAVFLAFCCVSSAMYLFNDINDRELDRLHPSKRDRPIASGKLSVGLAATAAAFLACSGLLFVAFQPLVLVLLLAYGLINVFYSLWLKHIVIVDIFCIAAGFVLRVFAGGAAIGVSPSSWLILATFLLSLFLALAKRRHEILISEAGSSEHRPVLEQYNLKLVDELISVVTPVTLITYVLYTLDPSTASHFNAQHLYLTSVFVVFGIFRYLYLIHRMKLGGAPAELLTKDMPLLVAIICWIASFFLIVYIA